MTLPETLADPAAYQRLIREYNALTDTVTAYRAFRSLEARLHEAEEEALSSDAELRALATEEALSVKRQHMSFWSTVSTTTCWIWNNTAWNTRWMLMLSSIPLFVRKWKN